jgi:hypothetical protein
MDNFFPYHEELKKGIWTKKAGFLQKGFVF